MAAGGSNNFEPSMAAQGLPAEPQSAGAPAKLSAWADYETVFTNAKAGEYLNLLRLKLFHFCTTFQVVPVVKINVELNLLS
jgi:hypothetical protein